MRMHYSHEADALYIRLKEDEIENTDEVSDNIIMDYDKNGHQGRLHRRLCLVFLTTRRHLC